MAYILCYIMYFRLSMKSYVLLITVILVFVVLSECIILIMIWL